MGASRRFVFARWDIVIRSLSQLEAHMARGGGKAPRHVTWIICLVLYLVPLLAHFGIIRVDRNVADWCWIIGYGLLLVAVQVRRL